MERYIYTRENIKLMRYRWLWRRGQKGFYGIYGPTAGGKSTFLKNCFEDREVYRSDAVTLCREPSDDWDEAFVLEDAASLESLRPVPQFVPQEDYVIIEYLDMLRNNTELLTSLFALARQWAEDGKLVIFTSNDRESFRQARGMKELIEVLPAPVNEFTVNCVCEEHGFWPDDSDYRTLLEKESLADVELAMNFVKLFDVFGTEPRQEFRRYRPEDADQQMYLLFSPYLTYQLTWREEEPEDSEKEGDSEEHYEEDYGEDYGEGVEEDLEDEFEDEFEDKFEDEFEDDPEEETAYPVYERISPVPEELRAAYENFFSSDVFVESTAIWGGRVVLGVFQPERYQKMIGELRTLAENKNKAMHTFYRLIALSAAEIDRQEDDIPGRERLFLSSGISDGEKHEALAERIRCYFAEDGQWAVLLPEREAFEEQDFWRF